MAVPVKISVMVPAHSIPIWTSAAQAGIPMFIFRGSKKEADHGGKILSGRTTSVRYEPYLQVEWEVII